MKRGDARSCVELALFSDLRNICCPMRRGVVVLYACYHFVGESYRFISRRDVCSGAWSALVGLVESALVGFVQSSEVVSLSAWSALVGLVESRAFCASQALASCVHACMPQLRLRALSARRGRGYVEKQKGRSPSEENP